MEQRDRLIELLNYIPCKTGGVCSALDGGRCVDLDKLDRCQIEAIADHILADGWIRPPCKVGDTVYCIYGEKVIKGTVRLIRPFISEKEIIFKGNIICEVDNIFLDDGSKEEIELYIVFENPYGIERVAYLTREEADAELERRKQ